MLGGADCPVLVEIRYKQATPAGHWSVAQLSAKRAAKVAYRLCSLFHTQRQSRASANMSLAINGGTPCRSRSAGLAVPPNAIRAITKNAPALKMTTIASPTLSSHPIAEKCFPKDCPQQNLQSRIRRRPKQECGSPMPSTTYRDSTMRIMPG